MDYETAKALIEANDLNYMSPDYYRVEQTGCIALALRDNPVAILHDVKTYASVAVQCLFADVTNAGIIQQSEVGDAWVHDVVDSSALGAPYYSRSHIAMQIGFPDLYWDYFEGEHIWALNHPKMMELVQLCVSCLTNPKHPSDFYGKHEIEAEPKPGRPKSDAPPKEKNTVYQQWLKDCEVYKADLKAAWEAYQGSREAKKEVVPIAKAWRDSELDRLREEMKQISVQYETGLKSFDENIKTTKEAHAKLKTRGKPKRP